MVVPSPGGAQAHAEIVNDLVIDRERQLIRAARRGIRIYGVGRGPGGRVAGGEAGPLVELGGVDENRTHRAVGDQGDRGVGGGIVAEDLVGLDFAVAIHILPPEVHPAAGRSFRVQQVGRRARAHEVAVGGAAQLEDRLARAEDVIGDAHARRPDIPGIVGRDVGNGHAGHESLEGRRDVRREILAHTVSVHCIKPSN